MLLLTYLAALHPSQPPRDLADRHFTFSVLSHPGKGRFGVGV